LLSNIEKTIQLSVFSMSTNFSLHSSFIPPTSPHPHHLFETPRDVNKLVTDDRRRPSRFIPQFREPSPVIPRLFQQFPRESTKHFGVSIPRIDLSKPTRRPAGCQSPLEIIRPILFEQPREVVKYQELIGSHPKSFFPRDSPPRETMGKVIPNSPKLFAEPREVLKYQEVERSHPPILDLKKPPRDIFPVCEPSSCRRLFEEPRSWQKLVEAQKVVRRLTKREDEETLSTRRRLFEEPREVMKYMELPGSHPTPSYRGSARRVSPTFSSSIFS
jgi:hypothetical protein